METRINVAKLLENCPKGMKLDCAMFEDVELDCVIDGDKYPIKIIVKDGAMADITIPLTKEGYYSTDHNPKCIIFPRGKASWEGFVPPVEFKDGDIVATNSGAWIGIMEKEEHDGKVMSVYCVLKGSAGLEIYHKGKGKWCFSRLATEEEKQRLFKAIEDNGYKWNPETKTLEKLEPQYPKTYKECCDILGLDTMANDAQGYKSDLIIGLQELIICRDAYWKIAGAKMRLKKPWKPDYTIDEDGTGLFKICIKNMGGKIKMVETAEANTILAFPTTEMRDAFYVNFKDSIERSKELL